LDRNLGELNVYRLQVLPGSEYHKLASSLGLKYDSQPPYFIHETPTLGDEQLSSLVEELQEAAEESNRVYDRVIKRIASSTRRKERSRRKRELAACAAGKSKLMRQAV
jgi:hypothetical protein